MKIQNVTVHCGEGLHLRVAARIAKIVKHWGGAVHIRSKGHARVNACSAMELMMLGAAAGTPLEITADGTDEASVLRDLAELIEMDVAV